MVLLDENNNEMGVSKKAAIFGISAVVASRIAMATPGMSKFTIIVYVCKNLSCFLFPFAALTPVLINKLEAGGFLKRFPKASAPIQTLFCGFVLIFATPLGCAFFSQRAAVEVYFICLNIL